MNCPVCDRPRATPGEMNAVLASSHVCDSPACAQDKCWRSSNTDVHILDCNAHRVDWRERAVAAEALVTASQAAQVTQTQARIEAEERVGRLEVRARMLEEALMPFVRAFRQRVERGSAQRRAWHEQMPGGWPFELLVTMSAGRNALSAVALASRNAAERGEAAAEPGREAEELRAGIEAIVDGPSGTESVRGALQALLDRVDARDSLAFLEKHSDRTRDAALEEAARAFNNDEDALGNAALRAAAALALIEAAMGAEGLYTETARMLTADGRGEGNGFATWTEGESSGWGATEVESRRAFAARLIATALRLTATCDTTPTQPLPTL